jgi:hypothetical protein
VLWLWSNHIKYMRNIYYSNWPVNWAALDGYTCILTKDYREIFEGKATCRLHRMLSKNKCWGGSGFVYEEDTLSSDKLHLLYLLSKITAPLVWRRRSPPDIWSWRFRGPRMALGSSQMILFNIPFSHYIGNGSWADYLSNYINILGFYVNIGIHGKKDTC